MGECDLAKLKGECSDGGMSKQDYMLLHQRCAVCHWPATRRGRWLELHHIIGGAGRKDVPNGCNWLALCNRCHHALHAEPIVGYGSLPRGAILTAKAEEDGGVDLVRLAGLRRRAALPYDPCPIPPPFIEDRARHGGDRWP